MGASFETNKEIETKDIWEAYHHIDHDKKGVLDLAEVADVLRELGKSEREIQRLLSSVPEKQLNFESFQALLISEDAEQRASGEHVSDKLTYGDLWMKILTSPFVE